MYLSYSNDPPLPAETQVSTIEAAFQEYTERKDIAILLINQHVSTYCFAFSSEI